MEFYYKQLSKETRGVAIRKKAHKKVVFGCFFCQDPCKFDRHMITPNIIWAISGFVTVEFVFNNFLLVEHFNVCIILSGPPKDKSRNIPLYQRIAYKGIYINSLGAALWPQCSS